MDVRVTIDRLTPKPTVIISALPGTDAATYELAKPRIQAVMDALGYQGVVFTPLTEIEKHSHGEQTLIVDPMSLHSH